MNKPLKILQINACCDYKSTGVIAKSIGKVAEKQGMEMYYAYQSSVSAPEKSYQVGNSLDWKVHSLFSRIFGKEGYASVLSTQKLIGWIEEIKPDIVHFHNLHSHYINLNMLCDYLSKNDIPTVITMHDCWYFTGKCTHYAAVGCNKWQSSCGDCPLLKAEVPSWFCDPTSKVLKDRVSHLNSIENLYLVGCSNWISNEAKKSLVKPKEILTIYNGVDLEIFKHRESSFRNENNLNGKFVVLGMADKWSNPANYDAVKYLTENCDDNTGFVVVGCKEQHESYFKQFKNITTIGYVNDQIKLAEIYSSADVFVNLTHADTLPTVTMESICCETPVITYDCCGGPELILEDCGFVVSEGDYEEILRKIEIIKQQKCNGMVTQRVHFDKDENFKKYIQLYLKITDKTNEREAKKC